MYPHFLFTILILVDTWQIYIELVNLNLFKGTIIVKRAALRAARDWGFEVSAELEPIKLGGML